MNMHFKVASSYFGDVGFSGDWLAIEARYEVLNVMCATDDIQLRIDARDSYIWRRRIWSALGL